MKKWSLFGFLAMALALVGGESAQACSCAAPPPVKQALKEAAAVFAGRVKDIQKAPTGNHFGSLEVTLEVLESWKGPKAGKTVKVFTSRSGASCGYAFFKNEGYLVYAYPFQNQRLTTTLCTRTKSLDQAYEDLEALGPGQN